MFSKFFLKNNFFCKNKRPSKVLFLKSKNSSHPFRQVLNNTSLSLFCAKNCIFDNIKIYKNFDLFNAPYYVFFSKNQLKGLH